ncbi:MAG TPA: glycosyltransferase [Stellaceae bacterium]|nr:glycosyltransferase [Stellaceae bacterium]
MFHAARIPRVRYQDPWNQTLDDRIQELRRRSAERRVVYLYEWPDTSTFRYRVYNMIQALQADPGISATWFSEHEIDRLIPLLDTCDTLVLCRMRYSSQVERVIGQAQRLGIDIVFDVDDLVFDVEYIHLLLDTLDQAITPAAWDHWFAYVGRIGATMRQCNRVIVTNNYLASKAQHFAAGKDVRVIPNFLNREQLSVSDGILRLKRAAGFTRGGPIHLGYFSGTPTHNRDFLVLADALAELLASDERLILRLVGFLDLPPSLARYPDRVERFALQDFINLQRLIGETELNLVPLRNNAFTNCKSELKYFEAAVVGTVTIASPTFVFKDVIKDGVNGWIANSHEWVERISAVVADWANYAVVADRAARARQVYAPAAMMDVVRMALFGLPVGPRHRDDRMLPVLTPLRDGTG